MGAPLNEFICIIIALLYIYNSVDTTFIIFFTGTHVYLILSVYQVVRWYYLTFFIAALPFTKRGHIYNILGPLKKERGH